MQNGGFKLKIQETSGHSRGFVCRPTVNKLTSGTQHGSRKINTRQVDLRWGVKEKSGLYLGEARREIQKRPMIGIIHR